SGVLICFSINAPIILISTSLRMRSTANDSLSPGRRGSHCHPESESGEARVPSRCTAAGGAALVGVIEPRPAARDVVSRVAVLLPGAAVGGRTGVAVMPDVLRPLPDVAMHVEKSERVGDIIIADGNRTLAGRTFRPALVRPVPVVIDHIRRDGFADVKRGRRARATGVFPLGFGRQPVCLPCFLRQPGAKFSRVLPGD